jgi:hypothetical protein
MVSNSSNWPDLEIAELEIDLNDSVIVLAATYCPTNHRKPVQPGDDFWEQRWRIGHMFVARSAFFIYGSCRQSRQNTLPVDLHVDGVKGFKMLFVWPAGMSVSTQLKTANGEKLKTFR